MPTGGGKSICFQVPALAMDGLCLVVSPLIALMKDQVENLRRKNISAYALYAGMSYKEVQHIFKLASVDACKFLYVSPERLETRLFKEWLPALGISLIAVDEAHCISQWGYDFRPPYLRIAALRAELRNVPVLALTASATAAVQTDICDKLRLKNPSLFRQSFERANLSFSAQICDAKIPRIIDIIQKVPGSAIVYCRSRRRTQEISDAIRLRGISSEAYHAGLDQEERSLRQKNWIQNKIQVIVCTNAFGMGIDKPDVKLVVHADPPDCIENYYQEAGRAGRDGKKAYAVLLFNEKEPEALELLPDIRFPSLEAIREVYKSLMNYLQLPAGSGADSYFDFDLNDFIKKFKLEAQLVFYVLKTLEQEEWLALNEQVFSPSRVLFTCNKETLQEFEKQRPDLDPIVKCLLRTYGGILDMPVAIFEKSIAWLMRSDAALVKGQLQKLDAAGIIDYSPQKDNPQLYFFRARIQASDLKIDMVSYLKRKEEYKKRIRDMIRFIRLHRECRAKYIAQYFGDEEAKDCGTCDNCLKRKKKAIQQKEFDEIHTLILEKATSANLPAPAFYSSFEEIDQEHFLTVVKYLQQEEKIFTDANGFVRVKR
jgi:ATP-dependent DNA helicase RecQ